MKDYKIIIVGFGVVGKLEYNILQEKFNPDFLDIKKSRINNIFIPVFENAINEANKTKYDLAIIAVPTPLKEDRSELDCHLVEEAVNEVNAEVYLVKSTTNIGYCYWLRSKIGKRIVHSPEHSGATQHCNNFEYDFTILGGKKKDCQYIQQIYQEIFDARHKFMHVNSNTSEFIKFAENSYLANKVSYFTSLAKSCKENYDTDDEETSIAFEEVREGMCLDPRIDPAHTYAYYDQLYWDSHCFNKDIPAFANQTKNEFLQFVDRYNTKMKEKHKNN